MGLILDNEDGKTPLEEDEKEGLLIKSISTRGELDEFEQQNIEKAIVWTLKRKFNLHTILNEKFIREMHKQMYGSVWAWAGDFRKTDKNIGVNKFEIAVELKKLLDDMKYWVQNNSFSADETAIRFKHRLVSIHCFANGNGRHSRLMADVIVDHVYKQPTFSWGAAALLYQNDTRKIYLQSLKAADAGNYDQLIRFARS